MKLSVFAEAAIVPMGVLAMIIAGGTKLGIDENRTRESLNHLTESVANGSLKLTWVSSLDGKTTREISLQNPTPEDMNFINGFRTAEKGSLVNNIKINVADSNGLTFCQITAPASALSRLILPSPQEMQALKSARSVADIATACGITEQDIKVKYYNLQHQQGSLPYSLTPGIEHDARYQSPKSFTEKLAAEDKKPAMAAKG